jgi:hypothetical protein
MEKRIAVVGDFLELGARAVASGFAVAIVLAGVTLALAGASQPATSAELPHASAATAAANEPWSPASTSIAQDSAPADVDALWATREGERDAGMNLQIALGMLALSSAGIVAAVGRAAAKSERSFRAETRL